MKRVTCPRCQYRFFPYEGRLIGGCPRCKHPATALDRNWIPWQVGQIASEKRKWLIRRKVDRTWSYFKAGLPGMLVVIRCVTLILLAAYIAISTVIRFGTLAIIFWAIVATIIASIWIGKSAPL